MKMCPQNCDLLIPVNKPKLHYVHLWNWADFQEINDEIIQFSNMYLSVNSADSHSYSKIMGLISVYMPKVSRIDFM